MSGRIIFVIISWVFLISVSAAFGEDRLVPSEYSTIQEAIDDCNDGDTVVVAPGTYTGPGNRYIDFLGKAITVKSENGPESCIIDAEWLGIGFVLYSGEEQDSVIEGFTITHGQDYESPFLTWYGGGIYCNASPTIRNCIITDNFAHFGGGIEAWGSPTITNCIFTDNEALDGSAIDADDANVQIINCTIVENTAGLYGDGPAVMLWNGGTVANSILWDNDPEQLSVYGPNTVTYSDIQGGWPGTGNIDADPCFADANDFHLIGGLSPCFNAGDPNYIPEPGESDIDGDERVIGGRVDMGADEVSDCMAETNPDYTQWIAEGEPNCWCYEYQCRGDTEGKRSLIFWVYHSDLMLLKSCYAKNPLPEEWCICADFDHKEQLVFRVYSDDLAILKSWYAKPAVPSCGNPPDENYNFWIVP